MRNLRTAWKVPLQRELKNVPPVDSQLAAFVPWEFMQYTVNVNGWVATSSGGTVAVGGAASANTRAPGVIDMLGGSAATNYAGYRQSVTQQSLGGGPIRLRQTIDLPVLPTVADDFLLELGFRDLNASPVNDGVFLSLQGAAAPEWQIETRDSGSGNTVTPTGIQAAAGRQTLDIFVNDDATEVFAEIVDSNGTHTSAVATATIPSGTADTLGIGYYIGWLAGAANPLLSLDYVEFWQRFTGGRVP